MEYLQHIPLEKTLEVFLWRYVAWQRVCCLATYTQCYLATAPCGLPDSGPKELWAGTVGLSLKPMPARSYTHTLLILESSPLTPSHTSDDMPA